MHIIFRLCKYFVCHGKQWNTMNPCDCCGAFNSFVVAELWPQVLTRRKLLSLFCSSHIL